MKDIWTKLQRNFEGWEIHHTGGGIFVIRKDFKDRNDNNVMVAISEDLALVMINHLSNDKYISHTEFLENEEIYWAGGAYSLEKTLITKANDQIIITEDAKVIFGEEILEEIRQAFVNVGRSIWE